MQASEADSSLAPVLRRAHYCGLAALVAVALYLPLALFKFYRLDLAIWGVDVEGVIAAALGFAAIATGTLLALRRPRLLPLAVVVSLLVGLVAHKVAKEFLWALYAGDEQIGLGALGQWIDRHYSLALGYNAGALVGGMVGDVLTVLFCAAVQGNRRALAGGAIAGTAASLLLLIVALCAAQVYMTGSELVQFLRLAALLPELFVDAAILGGSIALGEHLALRPATSSGP